MNSEAQGGRIIVGFHATYLALSVEDPSVTKAPPSAIALPVPWEANSNFSVISQFLDALLLFTGQQYGAGDSGNGHVTSVAV